MQFRPVGKTGMQASVIGLGGEYLDKQPAEVADAVLGAALEHGINILDLFMPGKEVRAHIGQALKGRRHKILIQGAIGSVDLKQQYDISRDLGICKQYFEDLLCSLDTDYIDFGMLFYLDTHDAIDAVLQNGIADYARELKQKGIIRALGASTHNPDMARRLVEEELVDMLMFSINPAFDMMPDTPDVLETLGDASMIAQVSRMDPKRAELYRLCESRGIGITVMKSLGAGKLLSTDHSPFAKALSPAQCIHYALTRPAVASVLVGCKSPSEVEAAVTYLSMSDAERDYADAIKTFRNDVKAGFSGACVYCNHCLPCPAMINIASVHKCLDIAQLTPQNIPHETIKQYHSFDAKASHCTQCGSCEERCPFSVPVISNMQTAAALFER